MLDEPTDATQVPSDQVPADQATPPRRRRSASRPSGPPAAAPAAPETPPVLAEPVADASSAPETPDAPAAPAPADVAPVDGDDVPQVAKAAPAKRTRARKAAPAPAAESPLPPDGLGDDDVPGTVTTSEPAAARSPRRTRATRSAASPVRPEPPSAPTETETLTPDSAAETGAPQIESPEPAAEVPPAASPAVAPVAADDPIGAALAALDRAPAPRRRRSARREAGAPAPLPPLPAATELSAAIAAVIDTAEPVAQPSPDEPAHVAEVAEPPAIADEDALVVEDETADGLPVPDGDDDGDGTAAEHEAQADDAEGDTDLDAEDESDDEGVDGPRRRRRRRGGRRRRRPGDPVGVAGAAHAEESTVESSEPEGDHDDAVAPGDAVGDDADAEGELGDGARRRRRRRRRRGEDAGAADDDPTDVVVRVREPRPRRPLTAPPVANDGVTGIEGSTRMEAKRLRRREGRAAGRRRVPILSEAEFLARREAVDRRMLIRQNADYSQLAVLEDGVLVEHYVDRASATSLIGNVYLGKVQNVLPSMEAAFVDIGRGRNAVLYAGEVDWDSFGAEGAARKVEKVFKSGAPVLVQVTKDPVGAKGARLTSHISLPGRYLVYAPGGNLSGISRKLPEEERTRLKQILGDLVPDEASVIIRTAAEGATEEELVRDVNRLKAQWEAVEKKVKQGSAPQQLYGEPDLTVRIVRDLFTEDFTRLVVDGNGSKDDAFETVNAYVTHVAPHLADRLVRWDREAEGDLFASHRIDEQITKALERKVFLPSGGSLVIDRTEAMTVIDVNTGKFTGSGGNLEATVTSNNLEAAEEIVRQLRLRDIGGIIVIDFIDMVLPSNRELLLRRLVECLGRDRTRHQVAEVTSLGLVQMTRKKLGTGLAEAFTEPCTACNGRGYHRHDEPVDSQAPADGGERQHNYGRPRR